MKGFKYILATLVIFAFNDLYAQSVMEKAAIQRSSLTESIRMLRPMVYNFPCDPIPECIPGDLDEARDNPGERIQQYDAIKDNFQEGLVYFYERNFVNSYSRFLDSQFRLEKLLEELSQHYIDRAELMLRDSIEMKNPNDPRDATVVDIIMDYGPNSKMLEDFQTNRDTTVDVRRYDPRTAHYAYNRWTIEKNMEMGYRRLGFAKEARLRAMRIARAAETEGQVRPRQRDQRIEHYFASIRQARLAKQNAEFIFALKYPYDNYALFSPYGMTEALADGAEQETPAIDGVRMNWDENPFIEPGRLNPVFDLRIPEEYRRDIVDARDRRFDDEADVYLRFRYYANEAPTEILEDTRAGEGGAE